MNTHLIMLDECYFVRAELVSAVRFFEKEARPVHVFFSEGGNVELAGTLDDVKRIVSDANSGLLTKTGATQAEPIDTVNRSWHEADK